MIGSSGNQLPTSKNHLISINSGVVEKGLLLIIKDVSLTQHSGNSTGFRNSVPGIGGQRPNMYFLLYHNITLSTADGHLCFCNFL